MGVDTISVCAGDPIHMTVHDLPVLPNLSES